MNDAKARRFEDALARLPRVPLASVRPTPLEPMPRLSARWGGPPLYIKRDDLTGLAFGGNKTRMLELSLADALAKGADTIVCGSAVQSNYCRQMAAACARLGLELHLLLRPVRPIDLEESQGNNLLQRLFGAHVTVLRESGLAAQQAAIAARAEELAAQGRKVYRPRQDDTVDLDALAYAEVGIEVARQCCELGIDPAFLYVAALDTTQAGLVLGLRWVESPISVRGFCPFGRWPRRFAEMARIANQGARRLGLELQLQAEDFDNDDSYVGQAYGIPTPAGMEAVRTVARTEGILIDPVYTGKAMAALHDHLSTGKLAPDRPVVFLHTGGAPALFGYAREVLEE
ncbi:MAG: pyridoxal-phosphate dependent enzyme [Candidatus Latescibacterota bacterium]|jgi:1-aminocyclopropane-1-carboxylate deaminase/D-cysteine desulfhydrase-like pyridoxal-dependent ACC family enzyme